MFTLPWCMDDAVAVAAVKVVSSAQPFLGFLELCRLHTLGTAWQGRT